MFLAMPLEALGECILVHIIAENIFEQRLIVSV